MISTTVGDSILSKYSLKNIKIKKMNKIII